MTNYLQQLALNLQTAVISKYEAIIEEQKEAQLLLEELNQQQSEALAEYKASMEKLTKQTKDYMEQVQLSRSLQAGITEALTKARLKITLAKQEEK